MEFGGGHRKRGRHDAAFNGNGGHKKTRQETESFSTGIGSKSKPCTKFFSTSGCPFGEGCHFLHYVPGGYKAVSQMLPALPPASRNQGAPPPSFPDRSSPPSVKSRLCNKYNTVEGCKFGDKCHFAHGEWELGKASAASYDDPRAMGPMQGRAAAPYDDPRAMGPMQGRAAAPYDDPRAMGPMAGRMSRHMEHPHQGHGAAASFGSSATTKISIDASLAGAIIGKNGVNSKHICRATGAKLSIREHETDPKKRNIELEGSFDQISQASDMVRQLISNVAQASGPPMKNSSMHSSGGSNNFKTKICENFNKGSCTFGDRCHFAHGAEELRKSGM